MKPETEEHLKKVEQVIWQVNNTLAEFTYPDDTKTVMVIGFLSAMIEHHRAMMLLIRNGLVGSAFALARSIVEGMYRGMWIQACATDEQVKTFDSEDKLRVSMTDMAAANDQAYNAGNFFEGLRKRGWAALCSYSHSGMLQLGRRFTGTKVIPNYDETEIYEATTTVTTCTLILASKFLAYQNHPTECTTVEKLSEKYGRADLKAAMNEVS
jgi:hypothetical protein